MPDDAAQPAPLDWNGLGRYKQGGSFPAQYPDLLRTFYSPRDPGVHEVICALLRAATHSIVLNMYGYDDDEADSIIREKLDDDHVYVQMSLDKSQAGGVHERELLAQWKGADKGNSIAIGTSEKHAISHLKVCIVDGLYVIRGSTNWSLSGEQKQDNELTIIRDAVVAAETRSVLDINHDVMLKQMAARTVE